MTSSTDWGYDKLRDRRANNTAKQSEYNNMSDLSSYDNIMMRSAESVGRKINNQESARNALDNSGYDFTDLSGYDQKSAGNSKFDMRDVKFLRNQGKSDDDIKNYIGTLGADSLHESIRYNKDFSGDNYVGDHDRNTKLISDFDFGKGYNKSDINYLKSQGYTGAEIADDMVNRAGNFGGASAKFLKDQGRFDDWDKANTSRRSQAKDRAQEHIKSPRSKDNSSNEPTIMQPGNSNSNPAAMPDLSEFKTPMPVPNPGNKPGNSNSNPAAMPDLSEFKTPMPGSNSGNNPGNSNSNPAAMPDLSGFKMPMPGSNSGNNPGNSNSNPAAMPDLSGFKMPMPGSNSGNNSANGGLDLSRFMTPMGGNDNPGNNNNSNGGLDLSRFMTPMGGNNNSGNNNNNNNSNGGLDLSRFMTPMGGNNNSGNKNNGYGGLDLSAWMNKY